MRIQGPSGLPPQIQPQGEHAVQQGDTLASLASKFGITPEALAKANNLAPNAALLPGQIMTIPKAGQSAIQQGIASVQDKFEYIKPTAGGPSAMMKESQPENSQIPPRPSKRY